MRTFKLAAIAAALCLIGPGASAQNLLTNGNFETGNLTGWTFSGGVNVQALMGVSNSDAAVFTALSAATEGDISQTVATYTTGSYTLSFDLKGFEAPVSGFGTPGAPIKTSEFIALVGATQELDLVNSVNFGFNHYTFAFSAPTTSTKIEFKGWWNGGVYRLDNVSLTYTAPPAPVSTPEPGSVALLAGMVSMGGVMARRRRK